MRFPIGCSRVNRRLRDGPTFDRIDNTASDSTVDLSEIIETTRDFVERYDVSEQDFLDMILGGDSSPDELSEKFGCSLAEAQEVLEAADRVYMADTYEASSAAPAQHAKAGASAAQQVEEPVAFVQVVEGQLAIQFHQDSVYAQRYRIKPNALKELKNDPQFARVGARCVVAGALYQSTIVGAFAADYDAVFAADGLSCVGRYAPIQTAGASRTGAAIRRASFDGVAPDSQQKYRNAVWRDSSFVFVPEQNRCRGAA